MHCILFWWWLIDDVLIEHGGLLDVLPLTVHLNFFLDNSMMMIYLTNMLVFLNKLKKVIYCETQELMFLHFICCLWCSHCTREERQIIFEFNFPFSIQFNSKCKNLQWKSLPPKWEKCTYIAHQHGKVVCILGSHSYFQRI